MTKVRKIYLAVTETSLLLLLGIVDKIVNFNYESNVYLSGGCGLNFRGQFMYFGGFGSHAQQVNI